MLFPPPSRPLQVTTNFSGRPASNMGTNVISGGTAHTLSASFVELIASLSFDIHWVTIVITETMAAATQTDALLSIYVGAASAEQILIPTLLAGWSPSDANTVAVPKVYQFPLYIPAGSRISAKSQSLQVSKEVRVWYTMQGGSGSPPFWCGRQVECLGANTAASQGTSVTPGTTAEGTFTTIGTTGFDYGYVLPMIQGSLTDTTLGSSTKAADIGVGSALYRDYEDWWFSAGNSESISPAFGGMGRWGHIPAVTALQLRLQSDDTGVEPLDCCIYGVY